MKKICSVEGCDKKPHGKGMCKLHYQRAWRTGSPYVSRPCLHLPVEKKFWLYVDKRGDDDCWNWTGYKDKDGYGKLRVGHTSKGAHRISMLICHGKVDDKKMVLHECNNPSCVNPKHLYEGDQFDNMKDRINAGNFKYGQNHHNSILTDKQAGLIRTDKRTYKEIANDFSISQSQVGNIKRGDQRKMSK